MNEKNKVIAIAGIIALFAVVYGAYRFGANHAAQVQENSVDAADSQRVLYWHDPMVPGQRFDKPGKSPYMDMALVPVYEGESKNGGSVAIDPRVQQRLGVRTAFVEKKLLAVEVTTAGNVEYNDRDVAVVQARANGFVEKLPVRTPLQSVHAGEVLAELYIPEWVAAQEEYLGIAHMQSDARENLLAAAAQRMRLVGMSGEQIASVAQSKTVQARLSIRAPIGGVVTELNAREGMTVTSGAPLFRINGVATMWVLAEVPEQHLQIIKPGTIAVATATALPGVALRGTVLTVLPEISSATRTAKARIELRNDKSLLAQGMFVNVQLTPKPQAPLLVVPTEAVIATGTRSVVIVANDNNTFAPTQVEIGIENQGSSEIRSGLAEGMRVVTSAQFLIDSEASLKAAIGRMSDARDQPGASK